MTRPFVDKKTALRFRLVQRSVKGDDLSVAISGDRVYQPLNEASARHLALLEAQAVSQKKTGDKSDDLERDFSNLEISSPILPGESAKYGVFFDDRSYDYVQHLKPIQVDDPNAVFIEAVDRPTYNGDYDETEDYSRQDEIFDPAIKECLDALDDEAYEDADFEDDFVVRLNDSDTAVLCPMEVPKKNIRFQLQKNIKHEPDNDEVGVEEDESATESFIYRDDKDEVLTMASSFRGTSYAPSMAMTSIDNKFEIVLQEYEEDFDDLEDADVYSEASIEEEILAEALDEFNQNDYNFGRVSLDDRKKAAVCTLNELRREMGPLTEAFLNRAVSSEEDLSDPFGTSSEEDEKFDCQSIAATLSNTENIPHVIREERRQRNPPETHIRLSRRGIPIIPSVKDTHNKDCSSDEDDDTPKENKGAARSPEETPEEKKARKSAIKAERKDKRAQKKNLKVRFKLGDV